jgi:DNA-binding NtrC family response regulator
VVVLTGFGTVQSAVTCLQGGAAHFLTKPFDNREVSRLVERLGRHALATRLPEEGPHLIAVDPAMRALIEVAERAAASPASVLIEGASGTGKEVVARHVHEQSPRRDLPFLALNTAAVPEALLESELFGHERGAFTGADRRRDGIFAQARGGTVFLDEVASMPAAFQSKLLRVLQERVVRPIGLGQEEPVEFRLIAATNQDLERAVAAGTFREDLYYRLAVVRLRLPGLAQRPRDIEPLAEHFLVRAAATCLPAGQAPPGFSSAARAALRSHPWQGNVRELENAIQRALIVCSGPTVEAHHLDLATTSRPPEHPAQAQETYQTGKQRAIDHFQREFVSRALESAGGNVSRAAERCGLTRAALQRIMRQQGIERADFRAP